MNLDALNWDDVRVFVVASRSRSFREAAAHLGTTHPTVRRRLAALEEATGVRLFQRDVPGLRPTREGQELLESAVRVEQAMEGFARQVRAADGHPEGRIAVSMAQSTAAELMPTLVAFAADWPHVVLHVDTRPDFVDLGALEVDVAVRAFAPGRVPDPELAGRHATTVQRAAYGAPDARGWIASSTSPTWAERTPFQELPIVAVIPEPSLRLQACRLGMGLAMLPCFLADPWLPRRSAPQQGYDVWVLVHPDMRRNARLKGFRDALVTALRDRNALDG